MIFSKLDRALCNVEWSLKMDTKVKVLSGGVSDHSPLLITNANSQRQGHCFRYCNMWSSDSMFHAILTQNWKTDHSQRNMYQLVKNLRALKEPFRKLHSRFKMIHEQVDAARDELWEFQKKIQKGDNQVGVEDKEKELKDKLYKAIKASYQMKCQQSKQEWITEGDKNSKMFYAWIRKRRAQNQILEIKTEDGETVEGSADIAKVFEKYYTKLLGTKGTTEMVNPKILQEGKVLGAKLQMGLIKGFKNQQFPEQFISWVMFCVSTPSYTLNVNGSQYAYFKGARGLRQGDPMSPLLFVLVMEYLTRSFQAAVNKGRFGFHPMCASVKIVNLCFADDLIVVCKAETKAVNCIMKVLEEFKLATGLSINYNKSHIVFGGINEQIKEELLKITKMKMGTLSFTYLGSPITAARLSASDCEALVHKITTKIGAWGSRHFSYAARIRIINSVLMGIITF
ncbi:unnamed protein product [Cuscuta campestris]|uniref:Reverse transcriptase domain-containing protein n=1 Tax=Cuscuta campestris TaxID=132261 RepID=A0A484MK58_9ASTE|nr:unnamed protein product [Cuscuta campestris]